MISASIDIISKASNRYGDKLLDFMHKNHLVGLKDATEEQLIDFVSNDMGKNICFVVNCGWYDSDFGCTCPGMEKWYQCPLEPEPDWDKIMKEVTK